MGDHKNKKEKKNSTEKQSMIGPFAVCSSPFSKQMNNNSCCSSFSMMLLIAFHNQTHHFLTMKILNFPNLDLLRKISAFCEGANISPDSLLCCCFHFSLGVKNKNKNKNKRQPMNTSLKERSFLKSSVLSCFPNFFGPVLSSAALDLDI